MFLRELTVQAEGHVKDVGDKTAKALARLGIISVADLLCWYPDPEKWQDRIRRVSLKDFRSGPVCTEIRVLINNGWEDRRNVKRLKIYVEDDTGRAALLRYSKYRYEDGELIPGRRFRLYGRFKYKEGELQSDDFDVEPITEAPPRNFGRLLPVYHLTKGLSQGTLRRIMRNALTQYAKPLEDELPQAIIQRDGLLPKNTAIRAYHFPESAEELALARKTLIYEELFYLEVMVGRRAIERRPTINKNGSPPASSYSPLQTRLLERLPFALTPGQTAAVAEINRDMDGEYPMARLLQGDVGSGKTLVAFLAALRAVEVLSGEGVRGQAAIMAPTELLARQHAENAGRLLEPMGVRPAFLTGNMKAAGRSRLLKALAAGEIDIVVGTHALFSRDVVYSNLSLVVVDEQHRFGVTQRHAIMAKGDRPDLLMMSATPIPRTLALTVFGDMDVSVIPDLPPGRKPVKTWTPPQSKENKVYDFVRKELAAGRQAYFVYPLIETSDAGRMADLKDAESMADRLAREVFPHYKTALVHSRPDEEEKRQTMDAFRRGEIRVLVATSVVEVGVDVPNATCMVIEHAERFGLSALHQLRGRVGRGEQQSYCILVYTEPEGPLARLANGEKIEDWQARLKVMLESTDGFVIAEEDLKLRGPGQIAGIEQSGYLSLGVAEPIRDTAELARARTDAFAILEQDPALALPEHHCIAQVLERAPPFSQVVL
ncbi:ATP-dependent DNA helicase RecG [Spirochaetia bacterium]|nr:ATP-dependent DNA helicase RecG [Spirochaetia bacterium]